MNILVAVDLSPASELVVEAARGVAELTGVSVYILHAVEAEPDFICPGGDPVSRRASVAKEFPLEHSRVQAIADKLLDDGLDLPHYWSAVPAWIRHWKKPISLMQV